MVTKARRRSSDIRDGLSEDDFWPLLIEFLLGQRSWWMSLCAEFDLTVMQGHALRVLDPDCPVAMSVLAESLTCDASNVTGIVDKLESRGLIARQSAEHDRRIKVLAVTPKGRAIRGQLSARMMEPPDIVKAMPAIDRLRLAQALHPLVQERRAKSGHASERKREE